MKSRFRRPLAIAAVSTTVLALAGVTLPGAQATTSQPNPPHTSAPAPATGRPSAGPEQRAPSDFDARSLSDKVAAKRLHTLGKQQAESVQKYSARLGRFADVDIDPLTRTPRMVSRLNGYLTAKSAASPRQVVLDYLRQHLDALGLSEADLSTLVFRKDYVDELGMHNLSWTQEVDGTPVFGNGLMAKVAKDGRLLQISGSPVHNLAGLAGDAPTPSLSAPKARAAAARNVSGKPVKAEKKSVRSGADARTTWKNHDYAQKVWFLTPQGLRAGWSTYTQTADDAAYQHVIDAATGRALYRHSTVDKASGDAYVYDYYPGAPQGPGVKTTKRVKQTYYVTKTVKKRVKKRDKHGHVVRRNGHIVWVTKKVKKRVKKTRMVNKTVTTHTQPGKPQIVNFIKRGWLPKGSTTLRGNSVITWADLNDNDQNDSGEATPTPGTKTGATGKLAPFADGAKEAFPPDGKYGDGPYKDNDFSKFCTSSYVCTWDAQTQDSWQKNMAANENNAFYLASTYHDYLQSDKAIDFTPQAGNFTSNGGDPVLQQVLDGADTSNGMPDGGHIDNANMNTPPDGVPPIMQMYLWHSPGYPNDYDNNLPTSGAFDASVLLHEYTHGLSNRLVVDADGNSTLNSLQAGAMGEAWSDYYAMDYLVTKHFESDTSKDGEVFEGKYLMGGQTDAKDDPVPFRSMAMDCSVGSSNDSCFDTYNPALGQGGYTYGDLAGIGGSPEVHSSGEVWAQTLWDIRKAFGHKVADTLITRGMSLSAADPSMLDMRNAIIQADLVAYGQSHTPKLWQIFAKRGMGYFAGSIDSADTDVAEDFSTPPSPDSAKGSISGTVTNSTTGDPVQGATVTIAGFGTKYQATTDAAGHYTIGGSGLSLFAGTYPKVTASAPGYFAQTKSVTVPAGDTATADFSIGFDWAASGANATITDYNGPDFSDYGCGPAGAIDTSLGTGWGSTSGDDAGDASGTFIPKHITVKLPQPVDITSFGVDPNATCGDSGSSSTGDYKIEVSTDGSTWTTVSQDGAHFGIDDRGRINQVTPTGDTSGVQYVRFTILGDQVVDANGGGTFEEICGDPDTQGGFTGCQYADLSEFAVFGTASP